MSSRRSRRWVFTLNNPTDDRVDDPQFWDYSWLVWQKEEGLNGTPHLQGLVVWMEAKTLGSCKRQNPRAHWEVMRGTLQQAEDYVTKDETRILGPWHRGTKPQQGKRNDLYEVQHMIDSGSSMLQVSRAYFPQYVKFHRGFEKYKLLNTPPRNARPSIFIFWGKSGIGKTRLMIDTFPNAFWKPQNKWWDSYNHQDVVIFDEFYSWIKLNNLLRILDWYPLILETKGGSCQYSTSVHVFTSNTDPRSWYANQSWTRREALFRRIREFGTVMKWCVNTEAFIRDDLSEYDG